MDKYELYSVMITDEKHRRGSGVLFYSKGADYFYVLTCAHVIYLSDIISIHLLIDTPNSPNEEIVEAKKDQFYYSPIDKVEIIGEQSTHTCDIAVIKCKKNDLPITPTHYSIYQAKEREEVVSIGYPRGSGNLYYQQDELRATVQKVVVEENYFIIKNKDHNLNSADRVAELEGFSGAPVWTKDSSNNDKLILCGLLSSGMGTNVSRGRINVVYARYLQNLMQQEFGIHIESFVPNISEDEVAPGYMDSIESVDQVVVRDTWIDEEWRKGKTYIYGLQLKKAVDVSQKAINNTEFKKCSSEQKYKIYEVLIDSYRLAMDYDMCDRIFEEIHREGIISPDENITKTLRYFDAGNYERAEEFAQRALYANPYGNIERVLLASIKACKDDKSDISILSEFIGSNDELLIKPKDQGEEDFLYQIIGYVLGNRFKETCRAIRCLNKSFRVGGKYITLESLALFYYLHSFRNTKMEEKNRRIDSSMLDQDALEKSRDAFLRVLSVADEMWYRGTIKRCGPLMFMCFFFLHDNFRVYKHYHDLMKYYTFHDKKELREIQMNYLDVAHFSELEDLNNYEGLTKLDKKYFELIRLLKNYLNHFDDKYFNTSIQETDLHHIISEGEKQINEIGEANSDKSICLDNAHCILINLYGRGIALYKWIAISEVKRHLEVIENPRELEIMGLYVRELESDDFQSAEKEYSDYFFKNRDVVSFNELCNFYTRQGRIEKTKELYDSVLNENRFLIENQSEYFFRTYIMFYLENGFDLSVPIKCYIEHGEEIKDDYIRMLFGLDLKLATNTYNDPEELLNETSKLFAEGLIDAYDYNARCIRINLLNCRINEAAKYVNPMHVIDPHYATPWETMLFSLNRINAFPNNHWDSMNKWTIEQINEKYAFEKWRSPVNKILDRLGISNRKAIVVDLWAIYYLVKLKIPFILNFFKKIYIVHSTIFQALIELQNVNDENVRIVLYNIQNAGNVVIKSPEITDQLALRIQEPKYNEIHQALLLSDILECPAFVGEFRYPIPNQFKNKVIRPSDYLCVVQYMDAVYNSEELLGKKTAIYPQITSF